MILRSQEIRHSSGTAIKTPVLVPSFSSKGFALSRGKSEILDAFEIATEYITDALLVSAYDLHYKYLPYPTGLISELVIIDSGGYEVSALQDFSSTDRSLNKAKKWNKELLSGVYRKIDSRIPAALVSFDHPKFRTKIESQIEDAKDLFESCQNHHNSIFLAKPESEKDRYVNINNLIQCSRQLEGFTIIGVTEKELGYSILDRMHNIYRLRRAFDEAGISSPLHIFGSLDPISCVLYFMSGAEIFDGLTWLKYGYFDGVAAYTHNSYALSQGISDNDGKMKGRQLFENIKALEKITTQMQRFMLNKEFQVFEKHDTFFRQSIEMLQIRIGGG